MQKKDWLTITIGALAITITLVTGLVRLESRVSKLETKVSERGKWQKDMADELLDMSRRLSYMEGVESVDDGKL